MEESKDKIRYWMWAIQSEHPVDIPTAYEPSVAFLDDKGYDTERMPRYYNWCRLNRIKIESAWIVFWPAGL